MSLKQDVTQKNVLQQEEIVGLLLNFFSMQEINLLRQVSKLFNTIGFEQLQKRYIKPYSFESGFSSIFSQINYYEGVDSKWVFPDYFDNAVWKKDTIQPRIKEIANDKSLSNFEKWARTAKVRFEVCESVRKNITIPRIEFMNKFFPMCLNLLEEPQTMTEFLAAHPQIAAALQERNKRLKRKEPIPIKIVYVGDGAVVCFNFSTWKFLFKTLFKIITGQNLFANYVWV